MPRIFQSSFLHSPYSLTVISAILGVLSFPPYDQWVLIFIALIPQWIALEKVQHLSWKKTLYLGLLWNFLYSVIGFSWIAASIQEFGKLHWTLSLLGLFFFGLFNQWTMVIFFCIRRLASNRFQRRFDSPLRFMVYSIVLVSIGTALDASLIKLFKDSLGHSLYLAPSLRQNASWGGVSFLTWLILLSNEIGFGIWLRIRKDALLHPFLILPQTLIFLLIFIASILYGRSQIETIESLESQSNQNFSWNIIQGNIGDIEKMGAITGLREAALGIISRYIQISTQAMAENPLPDAIVWPETTHPTLFRNPRSSFEFEIDQKVEDFAKRTETHLLFGGYHSDGIQEFNSLFFLSPETKSPSNLLVKGNLQIYRKNILLPFGEYVPGLENSDWIREMFPQMGFFGRGPGSEVFILQSRKGTQIRIAPVICYEILFPSLLRNAALNKIDVILNITNDSWFGNWAEPYQHLALSVFRSIELRTPQIRSTNTGISTLISRTGELIDPTSLNEIAVRRYDTKIINAKPSLYLQYGAWFYGLCVSLSLWSLWLYFRLGRPISPF